MRRKPAATHHEDHAHAIGRARLEDIQRQRRAELAPVNHVLGALEINVSLGPGAGQSHEQQAGREQVSYSTHGGESNRLRSPQQAGSLTRPRRKGA